MGHALQVPELNPGVLAFRCFNTMANSKAENLASIVNVKVSAWNGVLHYTNQELMKMFSKNHSPS